MALSDKVLVGKGSKLIIRSGAVEKKIKEAIKEALPEVAEVYLEAVKKVTGLDDHTLQELRQLGHPYSTGMVKRVKASIGFGLHGDDDLVHIQSGGLQDSFKATAVAKTDNTMAVQITSDATFVEALMNGTPTMRPRRFHIKAYNDCKKKLWKPVERALRKVKYRIEK